MGRFCLFTDPEGRMMGLSYFSKVLQLFLDMDHMVGGQFEQGLANLETVAAR